MGLLRTLSHCLNTLGKACLHSLLFQSETNSSLSLSLYVMCSVIRIVLIFLFWIFFSMSVFLFDGEAPNQTLYCRSSMLKSYRNNLQQSSLYTLTKHINHITIVCRLKVVAFFFFLIFFFFLKLYFWVKNVTNSTILERTGGTLIWFSFW